MYAHGGKRAVRLQGILPPAGRILRRRCALAAPAVAAAVAAVPASAKEGAAATLETLVPLGLAGLRRSRSCGRWPACTRMARKEPFGPQGVDAHAGERSGRRGVDGLRRGRGSGRPGTRVGNRPQGRDR